MKKYIVLLAFAVVVAGLITVILLTNKVEQVKTEDVSYEEITMVLPTYGFIPEGMEEVVDAMNQISTQKCGIKVNYIFTGSTELNHSCLMRLKAGESIDIMPCLETEGLTELMKGGYLYPLDDLIAAYAPSIMKLFYPKVFDALKYDGKICALSAVGSQSDWGGMLLNKQILDVETVDLDYFLYTLSEPEGSTVAIIDSVVTPILAELKKSDKVLDDGRKVSDLQLTFGVNEYASVFSQLPVIEYEGYGNDFGVLLDGQGDIVNIFETPEYAEKIRLLKKWNDAGYIYQLQKSIDEDPITVYGGNKGLGSFTSMGSKIENPGIAIDKGNYVYIPFVRTKLSEELFRVGTWVIPANSEHKEAAMKILNLMYTDPDYVRTFTNGIEKTSNYKPPLAWMFGNTFLVGESLEESLTHKDDYEDMEFQVNFGFTYDPGEKVEIVKKLQSILNEYLPDLENGIVDDVDATLAEMNEKLYEAGLEEIMADKKAQLDDWRS